MLLLLLQCLLFASLDVPVKAESAVLIDATTGTILYDKHAHKVGYPASITKIATGIYALERKGTDLNTPLTASREATTAITSARKKKAEYTLPPWWIEVGSSHIGIKYGEVLPYHVLLYGMMVATANDASNMIAEHVSGSIPKFVEELNLYLKALGCEKTRFLNPHGLHHPDHVTTPYEMALITQHALKNPVFRQIVKTTSYKRPETNKQKPSVFAQTNQLLRNGKFYYPKAIGVKTGGTLDAKHSLVAAAESGGRTLIAVVMGCKKRDDIFLDTKRLFEAAFQQEPVEQVLVEKGPQPYQRSLRGTGRALTTEAERAFSVRSYRGESPNFRAEIAWLVDAAPIKRGQEVGEVRLFQDQRQVGSVPLFAKEDISKNPLEGIKGLIGEFWIPSVIAGCLILYFRKKKKR